MQAAASFILAPSTMGLAPKGAGGATRRGASTLGVGAAISVALMPAGAEAVGRGPSARSAPPIGGVFRC